MLFFYLKMNFLIFQNPYEFFHFFLRLWKSSFWKRIEAITVQLLIQSPGEFLNSEKSINSFKIEKKNKSRDYLWNNFFVGIFLITFRNYYDAKYMFLTSLIRLIFFTFAKYWNFDFIKILAGSVYAKHKIFWKIEVCILIKIHRFTVVF